MPAMAPCLLARFHQIPSTSGKNRPEQDFGFIIEDQAGGLGDETDAWFAPLAQRVADDLNHVGLPYCKGQVMATNPLWRKSLKQWKAQVDYWSQHCQSTPLLNFDIFFDFRGVWGEPSLAADLRQHGTGVMRGNAPFLHALFDADRDLRTARRWFGRLATEPKSSGHQGRIDLKLHGTLPLVQAVRLLSLDAGVRETGTMARLDALAELGVLNAAELENLTIAYATLADLLLRRQLDDFDRDRPVSNYIDPKTLSRMQRKMLDEAFQAIEDLRGRLQVFRVKL